MHLNEGHVSFACSRTRQRVTQLKWQVFGGPSIGSVWIPRNVRITQRYGALCRVPRHPAIGQAIEYQHAFPIAVACGGEAALEVLLHRGRQFAVASVWEPNTAR